MSKSWKDDQITERQKFLLKRRKQMAVDARNSGDDIETPELGNMSETRKNYNALLRGEYQFPDPPFEPRDAESIIAESGCNQITETA